MSELNRVAIVGAGGFGTAFGNALAKNPTNRVLLFSIDPEVVESINVSARNVKYFPGNLLDASLRATGDVNDLRDSDWLFLAIPASAAVDFTLANREAIGPGAVVVNMAKGFGKGARTICACLEAELPQAIASMKGPTFAAETINNLPSAFTFAARDAGLFERVTALTKSTSIFLDHTTDLTGVEILSTLKNIYAILVGILDGQFNSANMRFLVMTRAFGEMRRVLQAFGGEEETLFRYCGFGDLGLTALNDLSRNRTLGLLVGKGFFSRDVSSSVILEGRRSLDVFHDALRRERTSEGEYLLIDELHHLFHGDGDVTAFVRRILDRLQLSAGGPA